MKKINYRDIRKAEIAISDIVNKARATAEDLHAGYLDISDDKVEFINSQLMDANSSLDAISKIFTELLTGPVSDK